MSENVLKQVSVPGNKQTVPFRDWIAAHADRIPHQAVTIDEEELQQHRPPGYNYRQVINRNNARMASRRISINMASASSLDLGDASQTADSSNRPEEAQQHPFGLTEDEYQELQAQWKTEQQEQLEEKYAQIREEAYEEGYETASAEADRELEELRTMMTDGLERLTAQWTEFLEETEPHLAALAIEIAERILDAPLPETVYDGVSAAVHDAIDKLAGKTRTDVTLHPADYMRLKETGLLEQLESTYDSLHWHSDPELERRGEWIVETPHAAIRHLKNELLENVERTLDLPQD